MINLEFKISLIITNIHMNVNLNKIAWVKICLIILSYK